MTSRPRNVKNHARDLVERVLSTIEGLNALNDFELKATESQHVEGWAGEDRRHGYGHARDRVAHDAGTYRRRGVERAARLRRTVSYAAPGGGEGMRVAGEARRVGGTVYASGAYHEPAPGLPAVPGGFIAVSSPASLLFWPGLESLAMREMVRRVEGDGVAFVCGRTSEELRRIFDEGLAHAALDKGVSDDGREVEVVSLSLKPQALTDILRGMRIELVAAPALDRIVGAVRGAPVTYRFTLGEGDSLLAWDRTVAFRVRNVSVGDLPDYQVGFKQTLNYREEWSVRLEPVARPGASAPPLPAEMAAYPAFSRAAPVKGELPFRTLGEFDDLLSGAARSGDVGRLWRAIKAAGPMPLVFGDRAVFVYRGRASSVEWVGGWSEAWARATPTYGTRLDNSDVWVGAAQFPTDARLEYRIELDGARRILDPLNPLAESEGFGAQSVLVMPDYVFPTSSLRREGIARGRLTRDRTLSSSHLGYDVQYRVYTPADYARLSRLPVVYVTDGQDFLKFARMTTVLDNLIVDGTIRPLIAVFVDPRDTRTGENRRAQEFLNNSAYGAFIVEELVPAIDAAYRTEPAPDWRALVGFSFGGYHSAYFALRHSEAFHLIAILSPALAVDLTLLDAYERSARLPLKIFLSAATIGDAADESRILLRILQAKGYPVLYVETNEGHSYGQVRGKLDAMLSFFFGT